MSKPFSGQARARVSPFGDGRPGTLAVFQQRSPDPLDPFVHLLSRNPHGSWLTFRLGLYRSSSIGRVVPKSSDYGARGTHPAAGEVSGAWVFKGTRTPVTVVFENLEDGMTIDDVMEQFPVTRE